MMATVVTSLPDTDMPPALRTQAPGWRDPRLWIGIALVAVSVVVGARVVGGADETVSMWALRTDKAPGDVIAQGDLVATRVRFADAGDAERYFPAGAGLPATRYLVRGVGRGELLPRAGLGVSAQGLVQVSVALPGQMVPPTVRTGSRVDLWFSPRREGDAEKARRLVEDVVVVEAPAAEGQFSGATSDRQVVLSVPDRGDDVADVLSASSSGQLMLVGRG